MLLAMDNKKSLSCGGFSIKDAKQMHLMLPSCTNAPHVTILQSPIH